MDERLLIYLAYKFIDPYPIDVRQSVDIWNWVENSMQEPKGWLHKLLYKWVLNKVHTLYLHYQQLATVGIQVVGVLQGTVEDVEAAFVEFEIEELGHETS